MASTKRKDSKGYALRVGECQRKDEANPGHYGTYGHQYNDGYLCGSNAGEKAGSNGQSSG